MRISAWIGRRNPLLHAVVAAVGLDLTTDLAFGIGTVNIVVFTVTFVVVLVASVVLQRRAAKRILARQPVYSGAPLDFDGTQLELVSVEWTDPKLGEREELLWARPLGEGLHRLRSVPGVADGFSRNDVVRCIENDDGLHVVDVVGWGGHRTVRVAVDRRIEPDTLLEELPSGLSLFRSSPHGLCIDVHPEDDYDALAARLDTLADDGALTWYDASHAAARTDPETTLSG
jgi:hypothetical protein